MNVQRAAELTANYVDHIGAERDAAGKTQGHILWMLNGIIAGYIENEKAHRWLGYAQGMIVAKGGHATLDDMKAINQAA